MHIQNPQTYQNLVYIVDRLDPLMSSAEKVAWLDSPHDLLAGETPRDLVYKGQTEKVLVLIERMEDLQKLCL